MYLPRRDLGTGGSVLGSLPDGRVIEASSSPSSIGWGTGTIIAVAFSVAAFIILSIGFCFLVRKTRPFPLRFQSSATEKVLWSPITSLDPTPLPSPTRSMIWSEKRDSSRRNTAYVEDADSSFSATKMDIVENGKHIVIEFDQVGGRSAAMQTPSPRDSQVLDSTPNELLEVPQVDDEDVVSKESEYSQPSPPNCISPLPLSPRLARLPSVKYLPSARVSQVIRPSPVDANTTWGCRVHICDTPVQEGTDTGDFGFVSSNPKEESPLSISVEAASILEKRMTLAERRSGLFLPNEFPHLFADRARRASSLRNSALVRPV
ncbi:hypothetical protein CC1G_07805 [Coprinopsis cinerea okayama7|uniref:Uncharacterized protein n=1 Tax=Coprinopsis cinerea (strain Okayama-7 / 130 / ATCC MYA-4618 / FGSC 9003) TaxID=240176 RepID=A8NP44_COPC7|nr:hypothetical protein CC1G_07805 [Coprinopsis cinerea okayama7\|eukprot:XP_001835262.1 hypothetical protein CC1G_07805 [Coprinopsis cinerea okayama7\